MAKRLRSRTASIEEQVFSTVVGLGAGGAPAPPDYVAGVRAAVAEVVRLALSAIESRQDVERLAPIAVLAQAKRAAREGVGLDTVLRRYAAGDRALAVFVAEESKGLADAVLRDAQEALGVTVDWLMATVSDEYAAESARIADASRDQVYEEARRILAGDLSAEALAGYPLDLWHVALVGDTGLDADALRDLAREAKCQMLLVSGERDQAWAWIGRRQDLSTDLVIGPLAELAAGLRISVAIGEARRGIDGWRLSHNEAEAVLGVPGADRTPVVRAREVALTMAVLKDPVLRASLFASYVEPLEGGRQGASLELRETLLSYLRVGQNIKPVTALLGIDRHTVKRRLRTSEGLIGRSIEDCAAELQTALRVEQMLAGPEGLRRSGAAR